MIGVYTTMKRCAIVGSRDFPKLSLIVYLIQRLIDDNGVGNICIVSGAGGAVDLRAEHVAREYGIAVDIYPALWRGQDGKQPYDKAAGIKRNKLIVMNSHVIYAFYSGIGYKFSGTLSTVEFAAKAGTPFKIFTPYDIIDIDTKLL
jgi:hypothetical protein